MAAAVEVDEGLEGDLLRRGGGGVEFFGGGVVAVDVGLVVFIVVEFHDAAGDGGFEGAIVVCLDDQSDGSLLRVPRGFGADRGEKRDRRREEGFRMVDTYTGDQGEWLWCRWKPCWLA